ncbi:MAG: sensor histidine kinase [Bacillota bacterium]
MRSITLRLTLWYSAILVLILAICSLAAFWEIRYLLYKEAAQKVEDTIATFQKLTVDEKQNEYGNHIDPGDQDLIASVDNGVLLIQITTLNGNILSSSRNLGSNALAPRYTGPPVTAEFKGQNIILAGSKLTDNALIQVAYPLDREKYFLKLLTGVLGILALGGLLLAAAGGWITTWKALRPLHSLTRMARQISVSDLSFRINLQGPRDEIYILAETFNQMLDRLEKGFQSQQEFVAAASHDLRTPLTIIKSYTDLLKRWGKDDRAVVEESAQAMTKSVKTMERLINDMLLLARMQARPDLEMTPLALDELAEETVKEARAMTDEINIKLDTADNVVVAADKYHLRRALWALLDNAVKYNRPGGEIEVSITVNAGEASLSVTDTGVGIEPKDLTRIFDRFYRVDQARTPGKGFGLGLSLAREIVEAHRGRITVNSQPGSGSRFTITLPLVPDVTI